MTQCHESTIQSDSRAEIGAELLSHECRARQFSTPSQIDHTPKFSSPHTSNMLRLRQFGRSRRTIQLGRGDTSKTPNQLARTLNRIFDRLSISRTGCRRQREFRLRIINVLKLLITRVKSCSSAMTLAGRPPILPSRRPTNVSLGPHSFAPCGS